MRSRPQPNPRRGLFRAAIAVALLIVLLFLAIIGVQSLTAPSAKAPTAPATPGPVATPHPVSTPARPLTTPTATHKKALGLLNRSNGSFAEVSEPVLFRSAQNQTQLGGFNATRSPDGRLTAAFQGSDAYRGRLVLSSLRLAGTLHAGSADPLVRPVWSRDSRYLLFVRVAATRSFPGAQWSLLRFDVRSDRVDVLARVNAMTVFPLGWSRAGILYAVGNTADTSIYAYSGGRTTFFSTLMPQLLTSAFLSPGGHSIAFAAPTNCAASCTLDVFDTRNPKAHSAAGRVANELAIAWTPDSRQIVTVAAGKLAVIDVATRQASFYPVPGGLPIRWDHPMRANVSTSIIRLTDTVSGRTYSARA